MRTKHKRIIISILTALYIAAAAGTASAESLVTINDYAISPRGQAPVVPKELKADEDARFKKWIVQFTGPIREEEKKALVALGARISDYLPDFAFIIAADNKIKKDVESLSFVQGVWRLQPAYKVHKKLKNERGEVRTDSTMARLRVRIDGSEYLSKILAYVHKKKGKIVQVGRDVAAIEISRTDIAGLARLEEVLWIEEMDDLRVQNDGTTWVVQSDQVNQTPIWNRGLRGEGQIIGIGDTGLDNDMPWFRDPAGAAIGPEHRKIIGYDSSYGDDYDADDPGHGTHVAGTIGGDRTPVDGSAGANGVAPKARFFIQDLTPGSDIRVYPPPDLGLLFQTSFDAGARIHSNSWGSADTGYTTLAMTADRFLWENKGFLALFSAGNAGPSSGTVGSPGTAKNVITVGASLNSTAAGHVASFSSNGPTADGRIKPTVMAPGDGVVEHSGVFSADSDGIKNSSNSSIIGLRGTSMATAAVSGAAALVRQYFTQGFYPSGSSTPADAFSPTAALIKAVIVNSAQNMTGDLIDGPVPSTGQGWGRVNLSKSLAFQGDGNYLSVIDHGAGLQTGAVWKLPFQSTGGDPLKVTLVWTDYPAAEAASRALVNDLDLIVTAPDGSTNYFGNVFSSGYSLPGGGADRFNVEEQVLIADPAPGTYTVTVSGYNVPFGPQPFAVVVTGASSITSKGTIALNRKTFSGSSSVTVTVTDRDLNVHGSVVEEVFVTLASTSEPAGEEMRLVETGPNTSVFSGVMPLRTEVPAAQSGFVEVANGDTLTALYQDEDTGTGAPAAVTATALIDTVQPEIHSIVLADVSDHEATITWATNEPADSAVYYGLTGPPATSAADLYLKTQHSLILTSLLEGRTYLYEVRSSDEAGNTAQAANGGAYYSLQTANIPPTVSVYSSNSSETYLDSTIIFGVASDISGVASVKVNGLAAAYRTSDGYFELPVALEYGENLVTVAAADSLGNIKTLTIVVVRLQKPDLVVESFIAPPSGSTNAKIAISDTVFNNGPGDSRRFNVGYYLSQDAEITTTDYRLGARTVPFLPVGSSSTETTSIEIPSSIIPGAYFIGVIVDPDDDQLETVEINNSSVGTPISIEGPDLTATITLQAGTIVTGGTLTAINSVSNNSSSAGAKAFAVGIYLSSDANITTSDVFLGSREVTGLNAGQTSTASTTVAIPKTIAGGMYFVGAIADIHHQITESNEQNNASAGHQITITGPDLAMESLEGPPSARTGETITIRNAVAAAATGGAAPNSYAGLYLSRDEIITTSDVLIAVRPTGELQPGASSIEETQARIPTGIAGGRYYLGAIADVYNYALESDESNNTKTAGFIDVIAPDLIVLEVQGPAAAIPGASVTVTTIVAAAAEGGEAGSFALSLYLAPDPAAPETQIFLGERRVAGLTPGATSAEPMSVIVPVTLAGGTYTFVAVVDPGQTVAESNEDNNRYIGSQIVVVKPDLVMVSLSGPLTSKTGGSIALTDTVRAESSGAASGPFVVGYYLSSDAIITQEDILIGARTVNDLMPGEASTATTTVSVPVDLAGGNYYLGAVADAEHQVHESIESNNAASGPRISIVGPDLTLSTVSSPAQVFTGGYISVTTTASAEANGGSAGAFEICMYLSKDATITAADVFLGHRTVTGLGPGSAHSDVSTFPVPVHLLSGGYFVGAIVDCTTRVPESNENNNSLAGNAVTVTGPDLMSVAISGPSSAITGDVISIADTVTAHAGGGASSGFDVWFYLSTDSTITSADTYLGSRSVNGLAAGESSSAITSVTVPTGLASGSYWIGTVVDPQNYVAESNEDNNSRADMTISITKASPDLIAQAMSGPAGAVTEQQVVVSTTVRNQGQAASGGFWISLYLSTDGNITTSDSWIGDRYIGGLAAGAVETVTSTVMIPAALSTATYTFGVIVDRWGQVVESNENNNTFAGNQIAITKVHPDLVMLHPTAPASAFTEDAITVHATVRNQGQGRADAFLVGIYLSSDANISTGDIWLGDVYVNGLSAGTEELMQTVVTIPATVASGSYYIGAIADRMNSVSESSESNNAAAGNQLTVTRRYPDLVMTSVSGPASAEPRAMITITATIRNSGLNSAGGFYAGLYLSTDQTITTLDTYLGQVYVSSLGAGAEQPVTLTVALPNSRGTFYYGAIADRLNMVAESNENNNGLAGNQITISR